MISHLYLYQVVIRYRLDFRKLLLLGSRETEIRTAVLQVLFIQYFSFVGLFFLLLTLKKYMFINQALFNFLFTFQGILSSRRETFIIYFFVPAHRLL